MLARLPGLRGETRILPQPPHLAAQEALGGAGGTTGLGTLSF